MLTKSLYSILFISLVSQQTFADSKADLRLFSEFGIGFRVAGAFIETPLGREFDGLITLGTELEVEALSYDGAHFLVIPIGYLSPIPHLRSGSEQITLDTQYRMVEPGLEYNYAWSYFTIGLGSGVSMMIVSATTRIYTTNEPVWIEGDTSDPNDGRIAFPEKRILRREENVGLSIGPFFSLEFGFDVGRVLGGLERLFELKATFQYARRQTRNELYGWMTLYLRPSAFWRKKTK